MGLRKFQSKKSKFWRQRRECCIFIIVLDVLADDGQTADLRVSWCRQLHSGWRIIGTENTRIRDRDYPTWMPHFPRGEDLDAV